MVNRDDVIRMFNEAGESAGWKPGVGNAVVINYLTHFAALVETHEREACAKVCDDMRHPWWYSAETPDWIDATDHCAAAIRARGNNDN